MSRYDQGFEDGRNHQRSIRAARQLGGGIGALVVSGIFLASSFALLALVAAPFLLVGLTVLAPFKCPIMSPAHLAGIGIVAFLAYAALYWVKGVSVGLHQPGRGGWWLLPFLGCVSEACLLPGWLLRSVVVHSFPSADPFWGWGLGAGFALLVYSRYRFTAHSAPKPVYWAYVRGYRLGERLGSSA